MNNDLQSAYRKLLTQILLGLDAAPLKIQSEESMKKEDLKLLVQSEEFKEVMAEATTAATAEALKEPLAKLGAAETTIKEQATKIETLTQEAATLKADKTARDEAAIKAANDATAAAEKSLEEKFLSWLKPGKEADAENLWATAKTNPWQFRLENPAHFVTQAEEQTRFKPAASTKVGGSAESENTTRPDGLIVKADGDVDWAAMGIKSPEILGKELQLKPFMKPEGGK
jgi:hypothetical protein